MAKPVLFSFKSFKEYKKLREPVNSYLQNVLKDKYKMMELAINEAVNNALLFGDKGEHCKLYMAISNDMHLVVKVTNGGPGFPVDNYLEKIAANSVDEWTEGGRGICIIAAVVDCLSYNNNGTEVIMIKNISGDK